MSMWSAWTANGAFHGRAVQVEWINGTVEDSLEGEVADAMYALSDERLFVAATIHGPNYPTDIEDPDAALAMLVNVLDRDGDIQVAGEDLPPWLLEEDAEAMDEEAVAKRMLLPSPGRNPQNELVRRLKRRRGRFYGRRPPKPPRRHL